MNEFTKNTFAQLNVENIELNKSEKKYMDEKEEDEAEDEDTEETKGDLKYNPKQKVEITFHLPDGTTEIMQENMGTEIGYLKLMLSKKLQKPYDQIHLLYNQKIMIDPLSIIDIVKENLKQVNIQVKYTENS